MTKTEKRICSVDGCGRPHDARGYCINHYRRWRRHGDPLGYQFTEQGRATMFWKKVAVTANPEKCWEWQGTKLRRGHGLSSYRQKNMPAPRLAWFLSKGEWPGDLWVLHKCDNPPCCNPDHLFLGTHQDNMDDKVAKGRQARGERCPLSKYTEADVRRVKELLRDGWTRRECEKAVGMPYANVRAIAIGQTWKHIEI